MLEILGGVFSPVTVNKNESLIVKGPSFTFTVMVAVPVWLAAGVMVTVRLLSVPPKTIPLGGTSPGLDELLLNWRLPADVCASPIVKGKGPAVAPINVVWFGISEIVGGVSAAPQSGNSFTSRVVDKPAGSVTVSTTR